VTGAAGDALPAPAVAGVAPHGVAADAGPRSAVALAGSGGPAASGGVGLGVAVEGGARAAAVAGGVRPAVAGAGAAALALVAALTLGSLAAVATAAEGGAVLRAADWRALAFTAEQAALSATLSVAGAVPLARALARRRFAGRRTLVALIGAPFLTPGIVAILGVMAVWGRSGWVSDALAGLGAPRLDIYGLPGVLIAHVFFNLPLATRLLLDGYAAIPAERWRVAAQLGVEGRALFRLIEGPALRAAAPGAFAAVFAVCAASFAVALALGGGPRATTLELAIYEAAAFEFDLARAALLAGLQFALCAVAAIGALALSGPRAGGWGGATAVERWDGRGRAARAADAAVIGLAAAFLAAPLVAVGVRGVAALPALAGPVGADVAAAAARSLAVAVASGALALAVALPLAAWIAALDGAGRARAARAVEIGALLPVAASPFVLGVGLYVALRPLADPAALALPLTALVTAAMAAPFAVRALAPPLRDAFAERGRLADQLGLRGLGRARALYAPRLRGPLAFSAGLSAALAAGDLGVIALFSRPDAPTLPLLVQLLAAGRRTEAAYAAALALVALGAGLFVALDRLGRR
jgi:thiamine transport system permease protein